MIVDTVVVCFVPPTSITTRCALPSDCERARFFMARSVNSADDVATVLYRALTLTSRTSTTRGDGPPALVRVLCQAGDEQPVELAVHVALEVEVVGEDRVKGARAVGAAAAQPLALAVGALALDVLPQALGELERVEQLPAGSA